MMGGFLSVKGISPFLDNAHERQITTVCETNFHGNSNSDMMLLHLTQLSFQGSQQLP